MRKNANFVSKNSMLYQYIRLSGWKLAGFTGMCEEAASAEYKGIAD